MEPEQPRGQDLVLERVAVFRRSIRGLPDGMLHALATGLDRHRGDLVPGRLYKSRKRGGCIVGVMLRELDPERYEPGPLRFWLVDRWRRRSASYRGALARNPRLRHIEWTFDHAVVAQRKANPGLSRRDACAAVGETFRRAVADELAWRAVRAAASAAPSRDDDRAGLPAGA